MSRARLLAAVLAASAISAGGLSADAITYVPPNATNVRWWLGAWNTNFGLVFFQDIYRARSDVPDANGNPQYYWKVEGVWTMPNEHQVKFQGALDPRDHLTFQGCYLARGVSDPGTCYPMLIYGSETGYRISHGYWKPCFLPESCHSHHPWTGERKEAEWRAGFRFTQRGYPDGRRTIRTQTGGAGTVVWPHAPVATARDRGLAVHGSALFNIDEIDTGNLRINMQLSRGFFNTYGHSGNRQREMTVEGVVTSSNDPKCNAGRYGYVRLFDRHTGQPDRIELNINGCRDERWTSADPQRVRVTVNVPKKAG